MTKLNIIPKVNLGMMNKKNKNINNRNNLI